MVALVEAVQMPPILLPEYLVDLLCRLNPSDLEEMAVSGLAKVHLNGSAQVYRVAPPSDGRTMSPPRVLTPLSSS